MKLIHSLFLLTALALPASSATVVIDYVSVGDAGNPADSTGYGAVPYAYQIGKYEVTNAQYGEFLNAKGQSNASAIYNSEMASYGIEQSGSSGSYIYTVTSALANRPVVYVSWFDAARFANWMMNGQGSSDMETGAYMLNGATSGVITAEIGAQVYIPSENEWYKAAYYQGDDLGYSRYPNGQNGITTGDANYSSTGSTDVGSYFVNPSTYGTSDQGGNVSEWNDSVTFMFVMSRGLRGGAWNNETDYLLHSFNGGSGDPTTESNDIGFRVASVPETTSLVLTMLAGSVMLARRKR